MKTTITVPQTGGKVLCTVREVALERPRHAPKAREEGREAREVARRDGYDGPWIVRVRSDGAEMRGHYPQA